MGRRKYLNRFAILFFAFMLFFTMFSGKLREQAVPKVMAIRARERAFPVTVYFEDGFEYVQERRELAVPVYVLDNPQAGEDEVAQVFVLEETDEGFFVRERQVKLGVRANGWVEVKSGVNKRDKVVYAADRELLDGMAVTVVEPEE